MAAVIGPKQAPVATTTEPTYEAAVSRTVARISLEMEALKAEAARSRQADDELDALSARLTAWQKRLEELDRKVREDGGCG